MKVEDCNLDFGIVVAEFGPCTVDNAFFVCFIARCAILCAVSNLTLGCCVVRFVI